MESALVETATGAAYAFGGGLSIYLSTRLKPTQMLYFNFIIILMGSVLLILFFKTSLPMLWIGNIIVGLGFSSTYASAVSVEQVPIKQIRLTCYYLNSTLSLSTTSM